MGAGPFSRRVGGRFSAIWRSCWGSSGVGGDLPFELFEFKCRHCPEVGLHRSHLKTGFLFELGSFNQRHRFEEKSHLLYSRFGRPWRSRVRAISSVVSFLTALVTCPSYVDSVSLLRGVGRFRRARSISCRVVLLRASLQSLAEHG